MEKIVNNTEWGLWTKKFAGVVLFLGFVLMILVLGPVMQDVVVAIILAFLLSLPIHFFKNRLKVPYLLSVLVVLVGYFSLIFLIGISIANPVTEFVNTVTTKLETEVPNVISYYRNYESEGDSLRVINEPISRLVKGENFDINNVVPQAVTTVTSFFNGLITITSKFLLIHFIAILFLLEMPRFYLGFRKMVPKNYKREYSILLKKIYNICVNFTKGQLFIALILGGATFLQCYLLGINGAVVIGIFAGIMALIPFIGGLFILIPVFFLPLGLGSSTLGYDNLSIAVIALIINLVIQLIVWNVVAPKISGSAVSLPVSIIILGIIVGGALWGTLGAILSAPIIAVAIIVIEYIIMKIKGGIPYLDEETPDFIDRDIFSIKN